MLSDFIQEYVTRNIWCAPFQDNQAILKLTRMSVPTGVSGNADVWWDDIRLPDNTSKWTLYSIGQNAPWRLTFPNKTMQWFPLGYWGERSRTNFELYFDNGIVIPTYQAYVLMTEDQGYIIAVKMEQWNYDLINTPLYMRTYRNGFWESDRSDMLPYCVEYGGGRVLNKGLLIEFVNDIRILSSYPGIVNIYHNGKWIDHIDQSKVKIGDYIYYYHDGSVIRVVDFKVANLHEFLSEVDGINKFVLHPAKEKDLGEIRYRDDLTIHLYKKLPSGQLEGRYYHRNREQSVRMLTHADYSVPVETVLGYIKTDPWTDRDNLFIRLQIRESGYKRPLVREHTHLQELYKMPDDQIFRAMIGIDATLDEWYAPKLEKSQYTATMRKWWPPFDIPKSMDMLGYNAMSLLVSESPKRVVMDAGVKVVPLSLMQRVDSTIFEYDANGYYLNHYYNSVAEQYRVRNPECAFVEIFLGKGDRVLDWIAGNTDVTLEPNRMYRFYVCPKEKDKPTRKYVVAREGVNYQIVAGVLKWIHSPNSFEGLAWSDKRFLINELEWQSNTGVYKFSLTHTEQLGVVLPIPTEKLFIIANGRSLVENVDYYVRWPEICFVNRNAINIEGPNKFVFVAMGMSKDLSRESPKDSGFAYKGIVSMNDRYDVREGRVMRYVVDGKVKFRDEVYFAEDMPMENPPLAPNGAIYESNSVYVPLRDLSAERLDELRNNDDEFVGRLEDFLTVRYPQPHEDGPNPIERRHELYSPILTQMLYDIQKGTLSPPVNPDDFNDVTRKMQPYMHLLDFDPTMVGYNENYVIVVPHPYDRMIDVDQTTYRFFSTVVKRYLKSKIKLNTHFRIKES